MNNLEDEIDKLNCTANLLESMIESLKNNKGFDNDPGISLRVKSILYYQGCGDYNRTLFEALDLDKEIKKKCHI